MIGGCDSLVAVRGKGDKVKEIKCLLFSSVTCICEPIVCHMSDMKGVQSLHVVTLSK